MWGLKSETRKMLEWMKIKISEREEEEKETGKEMSAPCFLWIRVRFTLHKPNMRENI